MSKLSLVLLLGVVSCLLEKAYSNNFYYYPNSQLGMNYQYQPYVSPYVYGAYAVPAVDCDKSTTEGGGEGGESSSSESSSSEEGGSTEGSSESSSEESKEGGESSSSSSEEEGEKKEEKKEEGGEEGKKEEPKKTVTQYVFPPVSYPFAPQTAQQVVYSAPSSYPSYMPYKTYSVVSQPATYSIKSSGYNTYPYYSGVPVSGSYSAPVSARIVSPSTYPSMSKTISFAPASGVGGPAGYWNGNVGYYRV